MASILQQTALGAAALVVCVVIGAYLLRGKRKSKPMQMSFQMPKSEFQRTPPRRGSGGGSIFKMSNTGTLMLPSGSAAAKFIADLVAASNLRGIDVELYALALPYFAEIRIFGSKDEIIPSEQTFCEIGENGLAKPIKKTSCEELTQNNPFRQFDSALRQCAVAFGDCPVVGSRESPPSVTITYGADFSAQQVECVLEKTRKYKFLMFGAQGDVFFPGVAPAQIFVVGGKFIFAPTGEQFYRFPPVLLEHYCIVKIPQNCKFDLKSPQIEINPKQITLVKSQQI